MTLVKLSWLILSFLITDCFFLLSRHKTESYKRHFCKDLCVDRNWACATLEQYILKTNTQTHEAGGVNIYLILSLSTLAVPHHSQCSTTEGLCEPRS